MNLIEAVGQAVKTHITARDEGKQGMFFSISRQRDGGEQVIIERQSAQPGGVVTKDECNTGQGTPNTAQGFILHYDFVSF